MRMEWSLCVVVLGVTAMLGACGRDHLAAERLQGDPQAVQAQWRELREELRQEQDGYSIRLMDHARDVASGSGHAMPRVRSSPAVPGIGSFAGKTVAEVVDLMRQRELALYRAERETVLHEQAEWQRTMDSTDALVSRVELRNLRLQLRAWAPPAHGVLLSSGRQRGSAHHGAGEDVAVVEGTVVNTGTQTAYNLVLQLSSMATDPGHSRGVQQFRILLPEPLSPGETRSLAVPLWELSGNALADSGGTVGLAGQVFQADLAENGSGRFLLGQHALERAQGGAHFALQLAILDRRIRQLEAGWTVPMTPESEPFAFASAVGIDQLRDGAADCGSGAADLAAAAYPGRTPLSTGGTDWILQLLGSGEQVTGMLLRGTAPIPPHVFELLDCVDQLVYIERSSTPLMGLAELVAEAAPPAKRQELRQHDYAVGSAQLAVTPGHDGSIAITLDQWTHARLPVARAVPGPASL